MWMRRVGGTTTRGSEVLVRLLGAVFQGVLCSDRFSAYLKYHAGTAQFCWAHLKRNLLGIVEYTKNSTVERFCRAALAEHAKLFRLWHKFRSGQIDRSQLWLRSIRIQKRIFALAERHLTVPTARSAISPPLFSNTTNGCLPSSSRKALNRPTTAPNGHSAPRCSRGKSVLATAAPRGSWRRPDC